MRLGRPVLGQQLATIDVSVSESVKTRVQGCSLVSASQPTPAVLPISHLDSIPAVSALLKAYSSDTLLSETAGR